MPYLKQNWSENRPLRGIRDSLFEFDLSGMVTCSMHTCARHIKTSKCLALREIVQGCEG